MATKRDMTQALSYAAVAMQVEFTEATVEVYWDQLGTIPGPDLLSAVKRWVREYTDPYRRIPTVGELRAIVRRGQSSTPADVRREMWVAGRVKHLRATGATPEQIDAYLDSLDRGEMIVR